MAFRVRRRLSALGVALLAAGGTFTSVAAAGLVFAGPAFAVSGAVSTTDDANQTVAGATTQACLNGKGTGVNDTNCNIYQSKKDVFLSGLPVSAALGPGNYFFAVLDPGGQNDPNDGSAGNLSSFVDGDYANRTFTVGSDGSIAYSGTNVFDAANNLLSLYPYDDTNNPGGFYILAVCAVPSSPSSGTELPGVDPSSCKYDAFKVGASQTGVGSALTVSKDASGAFTDTWTWGISKSVDPTQQNTSSSATFNYTVSVTHDSGTISGVTVSGTIQVFNPNINSGSNTVPVSQVAVTDQLSDGTPCSVPGATSTTLTSAATSFPYTCTLNGVPQGELDNTVTVTWPDQTLSDGDFLLGGTATFTFSSIAFTETKVDDCVTVTDTLGGTLGTVCQSDPSPTAFSYPLTFNDPAGTCTSHNNTASFTTNTTGATGTASQSVTDCIGADLSVSKTANPSFTRAYNWTISKNVDKTLVEQTGGGTATFNYTVNAAETGFTDSDWEVTGTITVQNPNDWEDVPLTSLTDTIDNNGSCTVDTSAGLTIPASGSASFPYTCTYASAPSPSSGTNTATAKWDSTGAATPDGAASGTASYAFGAPTKLVNQTVTVQDTFNGTTTTLGTLTATDTSPFASATYTYSHTVPVPTNNCVTYPNTAQIVETGQSASQTVEVCGPAKTGALTMGFWQNKNGQTIIKNYSGTNCQALATWLRKFHPFSDLTATTCGSSPSLGATSASGVVGYVYTVIKNATCTSTSKTCNSMLKAQMLATALDVYFSDQSLGGNRINAPAPIDGVTIDLTKICKMIDGSGGTASCSGNFENVSSAFGGATSLTVMQMLLYQNTADPTADGGADWYNQVKATQVLAKDAFDAINNQVAFSP